MSDRLSKDEDKRLFAENYFELSRAGPGKDSQYKKMMQIRKILKEYSPRDFRTQKSESH